MSRLRYTTRWGARIEDTHDGFVRLWAALLLAVGDMHQVGASCEALRVIDGKTDPHLEQALNTAVVVCYARGFTQSKLRRLDGSFAPPKKTVERTLHRDLLDLRRRSYAHTDADCGRVIQSFELGPAENGLTRMDWVEGVKRFRPDELEAIRSLAELQIGRLGEEAARLSEFLGRWREAGAD